MDDYKWRIMLARIRGIFAPPEFTDDEDKTRLAKVLNTLLISAMLLLVFLGGIAVPLFFVEKLYNILAGLVFLVIIGLAFWLMRRGRVRFAGALFSGGLWAVFTFYLLFSGGMTSVIVMFYLVGTVIAGLLLGPRGALINAGACCLAGLGMVILDASGHPLPRIFPVPPLAGWLDMTIALLSITIVLRLALESLWNALSLTRQNLKERQRAEEALRESEERFSRLSAVASEGIGISDQEIIVDANPQLAAMLGYRLGELVGMNVNRLRGTCVA